MTMSNGVVVVPFFFVTADVEVVVVRAPVRELVDQRRITVVREDHRPIRGEDRVELFIRESVRMLARRLEAQQIDDVDDAHVHIGEFGSQDGHRREHFQRRYVARAREHHVGIVTWVPRSPVPDADPTVTVLDRGFHREPHRGRLLSGDHHVDVVPAPETVVHHREQAVGVGREIDPRRSRPSCSSRDR